MFLLGVFTVICVPSMLVAIAAEPVIYKDTKVDTELQKPKSNALSSENVEYRLTRLEVQIGEKAEAVRSELRETNRRLQFLEWQSAETHSALESFKAELQRFSQHQSPPVIHTPPVQVNDNRKLEERIENLAKGIKIMVANMRILSSDMATIKANVSGMANNTGALIESNKHLLTKQFFNNGLLELRQQQPAYPPYPIYRSNTKQTIQPPKSCKDVIRYEDKSGVYTIQPEHSPKAFMAYCDMETKDGGWTVIHNRYEGAQDFYQNWHNYKHGFGNLGGEFWLGLENIHQITGHEINELLIELEDFNNEKAYAYYSAFSVGSEAEGFPLKVLGGYDGDAGDSLIYHAGYRFSTKDMDQDAWPEGSCAQAHGGGWWYRGCDTSNLNGKYLSGELPEQYIYHGMYWGEFRGALYSLLKARMLVRPRDRSSPPMFGVSKKNDTSIDF